MHENDWSTGGQADYLALSPSYFPPPVFDCYQYASTEKRGWGDLVTCGDVTSGRQKVDTFVIITSFVFETVLTLSCIH